MKKCFPTNRNIIFELNSQKITKRQKEIIHSFYKQQREAYVIKQKDKERKKLLKLKMQILLYCLLIMLFQI